MVRPLAGLALGAHYGSPAIGYLLSLASSLVAIMIRMAPMFGRGPRFPFVFGYLAIALVAFLSGLGPGAATLLLSSAITCIYLPRLPAMESWIALAIFGPLAALVFAHLGYVREKHRAASRELARFKFIGDHAGDWILLLDEDGSIRYLNLRAAGDLGFSASELIGRPLESLIAPAQQPLFRQVLEKARLGKAEPVELVFDRRGKTPALMELGCTAVRTGDSVAIHASARDVTERKRLERKLQELRHWESLGSLAGGVAHDFNNLLTTILGNASLARDILPKQHPVAPLLDSIVSSSERSAELVRLMLATSGYRSRFIERLRVENLLEWTLAERPLPANVRIVDMSGEEDRRPAPFRGDRNSFITLLGSLISNAAEAYDGREGEVRVAIRFGTAPAGARTSFAEGDTGTEPCLGIIVEDVGSGMSSEVLARAFEPFFSTRFAGRGLGLAAVRGIVRAYSGKLLLETDVGKGTRVEVWLPVETENQSPVAATSKS